MSEKTDTLRAVALVDVRSAENVGAIFRTADAVGVSKVYLAGYTPTPIDRFGRVRKDVAKTALGAEQTVPWTAVEDVVALLRELKEGGVRTVAVEQDPRAVDYKTYIPDGPTVAVYGNEITGLPKEVLDVADVVVSVPMRGKKESLNVAVTAGITLFRFFDR